MHRIYFDTFIPANYEKLAKEVMGYSDSELLPIREEDANNIFEKVLSLNEVKSKHPLGDIIIQAYGLSGDAKNGSEIASEHGVSKARIYQLRVRGLWMLRHPKRSRPFKRLSREGLEEEIKFLRKKLDEANAELDKTKEELNEIQVRYKEKTDIKKILLFEIEELDFSVRARNCLRSVRIKTLGQLVNKKRKEMIEIGGLGIKTLHEIEEMLIEFDLSFSE